MNLPLFPYLGDVAEAGMPVAEMQRLVLSETFETVVPLAGGTQLVFAKAVQDAKDGKEEDSDLTSLFFFSEGVSWKMWRQNLYSNGLNVPS